jgi:hypothetical protein
VPKPPWVSEFIGPLAIGAIGGFVAGLAPNEIVQIVGREAAILGGLTLTGVVAAAVGSGMGGFIGVLLAASVAFPAGLYVAFPEGFGGDLAGLAISGAIGFAVVFVGSGYFIGRILVGFAASVLR